MHRFDDSKRIRLLAALPAERSIASVTGVWRTANWLEREVYDMFGILFEGHPALERILTWEGFNGHPLRKDFPVEGSTRRRHLPGRLPTGRRATAPEELEQPEPKADGKGES